ncbi:MAG TPA: ANTAR domain-containing protein [Propionibacteriaceae bacterium]|nr:ANTAR domain-containing protein [Propionibacteriaceae bacterium]
MVELAQLRYAVRTRIAGEAFGSAAAVDGEVRSLLGRRDAVLTELRRRGLDFPDAHLEPWRTGEQDPSTSVEPNPDQDHAAPVDLTAKVEQLERGLSSRTVIGQAQGILIERHQVTPDKAFRILVQASNTTNRKLRDVAADLVLTGELAGRRRRPNRVPAKS